MRMPDGLVEDSDGWQTNRLFPRWEGLGPQFFPAYSTFATGFTVFQAALDAAIIGVAANLDLVGTFPRLKPMPWPSYSDDGFVFAIRAVLPLILIFAFIYSASSLTRALVYEKEKRLKEAMKMMGLSSWVHWLAWFIKSFLFLFVSIILITVIFSLAKLVVYSDVGVVFVLFVLFSISLITFCFFLSTLFAKANVAAAAGAIIFFLAYVPYMFIQNSFEDLSQGQKQAACLLAPTCMGIGTTILSLFETSGEGLSFSNVGSSPTELDQFSMADVYGMLIFDAVLYLLFTW